MAAGARGDMVGHGLHLGMGVGAGAGEGGALQQRQVGPVVADGGGVGPVHAQRGELRLRGGQLVLRAVDRMRQAQVGDAPAHRRRVAAGDDQRRDAGLRQQLQPMAVEQWKALTVSPCSPMYSRPSVSTPSTSKIARSARPAP